MLALEAELEAILEEVLVIITELETTLEEEVLALATELEGLLEEEMLALETTVEATASAVLATATLAFAANAE